MPFTACDFLHMCWDRRAPEEVPDEVVFADVIREKIDARALVFVAPFTIAAAVVGGAEIGSESIKMRAAEHIRLPNRARRDSNGGDGGVEFCVRSGEE